MLPLADTQSSGKFPFWVILIILINLYVFTLELTTPNIDAFLTQYALIPAQVNPGNLASFTTFLTSQFLHGGFLHIISNMLFLWVFGRNVEAKLGFRIFPGFYLLSGLLGGLAQYLIAPHSIIPQIGASGAIAGILGAYFAFFRNHKIKTLVFIFFFVTIIDLPASVMLFYWFFTQVLNISFSASSMANEGGVAYVTHVAGFTFGWILCLTLLSSRLNHR